MKRILAITAVGLLVATAGLAGQTASDSPATKEDIQKYLDVVHSKEMMTKLAFYSSPTDQKMIRELPAITAEAMQAFMPILREKMDAMTQRLQLDVAQMKKDYKPGDKPQATPN
jgi:hypothetical protein